MKKLLLLTLFASMSIFILQSDANAASATLAANAEPQWGQWGRRDQNRRGRYDRRDRNRRGRYDNNRGRYNRVRYETVTVRRGRYLYRETYRISYNNGRYQRKRVSRQRIRSYYR